MYQLAYDISKQAHKGQKDRGGNDYFNHPLYVSNNVNTEAEKIVALLHDVIEDTNITLEYLEQQGFSEDILFAIDCITKRNDELYDDYLKRVSNSMLATAVKLVDMEHNSDINRIPNPKQRDFDMIEKYKMGRLILIYYFFQDLNPVQLSAIVVGKALKEVVERYINNDKIIRVEDKLYELN